MNNNSEHEQLELEKKRLEIERMKLEINSQNQRVNNPSSNKERELRSIHTTAIWALVGWFLFLFPGLIAEIILIVKLFSFNSEKNNGLKVAAAVCSIFFWIIGPILAFAFVSKERNS